MKKTPSETCHSTPIPLTIRNEQTEYKWRWQKELAKFRAPGGRRARNPILPEHWATTIPNDVHVVAADLAIEATGAREIYQKLQTSEQYANINQIRI